MSQPPPTLGGLVTLRCRIVGVFSGTGKRLSGPYCVIHAGPGGAQQPGVGQTFWVRVVRREVIRIEVCETTHLRVRRLGCAELGVLDVCSATERQRWELGLRSPAGEQLQVHLDAWPTVGQDALRVRVVSVKPLVRARASVRRFRFRLSSAGEKCETQKHWRRTVPDSGVFETNYDAEIRRARKLVCLEIDEVGDDRSSGKVEVALENVVDGRYHLESATGKMTFEVLLAFKWVEPSLSEVADSAIGTAPAITKEKPITAQHEKGSEVQAPQKIGQQWDALVCNIYKAVGEGQSLDMREAWQQACEQAIDQFSRYLEQERQGHEKIVGNLNRDIKALKGELQRLGAQSQFYQEQLSRRKESIAAVDTHCAHLAHENAELRKMLRAVAPHMRHAEIRTAEWKDQDHADVGDLLIDYPQFGLDFGRQNLDESKAANYMTTAKASPESRTESQRTTKHVTGEPSPPSLGSRCSVQ
mmetsp:Transcript_3683/g.11420  ORF Transcript_3683/g.11420 Transcript_3683/m.11420 type:complete len:472 (+) Transcript_3683:222-1637(+)